MGDGADDGGQIGVVGLVARIGGQAKLLRRERMHDARFEVGRREGALDRPMVVAGAFDGDDDIAEVVLADRVAQGGDEGVERSAFVLDRDGGNQNSSVEVCQEQPRPLFGDIDGDNAETLGPDRLHARAELPIGLLDLKDTTTFANCCRGHENSPFEKKETLFFPKSRV